MEESKDMNFKITFPNFKKQPKDRIYGDEFSGPRKSKKSFDDDDDEDYKPKRYRRNEQDRKYDVKIQQRSQDCNYFRGLIRKKQIEILQKEEEIEKYFEEDVPFRYRVLYMNIPTATKSFILQKIQQFEGMSKYDSEYSKLKKWIKGLARVPLGNYVDMPVQKTDSEMKIQLFLHDAYEILEKTIYGQIEAKNRIIQIMAQWISNPTSRGQVIALEGPAGVGKTSLVKHGVSKALNRPFCFYALGGASDASNLEGHNYTYEGATWGRIAEMLMESKVMNPVIFFDELDKISDTGKGHEITGILTHLTDPTQNMTFYDKYFSGIEMDISRTLFFFSYNDVNQLNPILKDRLTIIKFKGYKMEEKIEIVKRYIIPDLLQNIGFERLEIEIGDEEIRYILKKYVKEEEGVRNIRRCLEEIVLKCNLLKYMNKDKKIEIPYWIDNFEIPCKLDNKKIDILLKDSSFLRGPSVNMDMLYI